MIKIIRAFKMKFQYLYTLLVLIVFSNGFSQSDTIKDQELPEVTVGSYFADKKTPLSYQNIDMHLIESKNTGQEGSFLLSETPSMTVYSDAGSYQGYSYFRLRGIDQTRINMTLDGVPLNEPEDQGVYFSNYPDFFNSVDKIQIQRGVGTSKNGTSSYAGSIQYSSPNLLDSNYKQIGAGYGSFNTYRVFGEYNMGIKKNKGLYVRASHLNSGGFKDRSANNSQSAFYSGGVYKEKSVYKLTGFIGQQRNQMAWLGVSQEQIDENPRANGNANEDDHFIQSLTQLQHTLYLTSTSTLKSSLYYNYLRGNYDFNLDNFLGLPLSGELYNYAFESHLTGLFINYSLEKKDLKWTSGIHGNLYSRSHTGSEKSLGELYTNTGYKNEFSVFSKAHYQLNKFSIYADVQIRHTSFDYEGAETIDQLNWTFINPKAGLDYQLKNMSLYYSIGRTGREPTRTDLLGGNDNLLIDDTGNPILFIENPEYVTDQELGMRIKKDDLTINVNAYYMSFDNEIVLNGQFGPNGLALNSAVESSIRTGLEIDASLKIKKWKFVNASSFNHSQIKEQSTSFTPILTPKLIVNQEVIYSMKRLETGVSMRYQSNSYIDFSNENEIEGYFLLNLRASYNIHGWTMSLYVNNVLNTEYYNHAYVDFDGTNKYFVQAPTNLYLNLAYTF